MTLSTGQVLNSRYRIVKLLGQGGFGAVYRAWDINFQMPCALKENHEMGEESRRQFQREAQMLHTLRHPNLPLVKDYFILPGQGQYLVMDYIEGEDLQSMMRNSTGLLEPDQVVHWISQVCQALVYLHGQKSPVIHRDIKPANIKITPEGQVVLVDFGIAKVFRAGEHTTQGARAVSPGFAPFEQYGLAPTDARTDIYAVGATAYALLTDKMPPESIARMAGAELPTLRSVNPEITIELEEVILRALAVMPDDRYQTAQELLDALQSVGNATIKAVVVDRMQEQLPKLSGALVQPAATAQPAPGKQPVKRTGKKVWFGFIGLVLLMGLLGGGWWAWENGWFEPSTGDINGVWVGEIINPHNFEPQRFQMYLELRYPGEGRYFSGVVEIVSPDGRMERYPIEGTLDGDQIRFRDFRPSDQNLYFWGAVKRNRIEGPVAWGCYMCDAWGEFRIDRK